MKRKNQIIIILSSLLFLSVESLTCCKSNSVPIPGQQKVLLKNLYIEYSKVGDAYFDVQRYSDAIDFYQKAMEELYWQCYYKIAKCYVFTSQWSDALEMFEILLEKDPENSSLKASIAYIYSMSGELENALNIYKDLLKIQPNNEDYIENFLAVVLGNKELFTTNKSEFEQLFSFFKENYSKNENIKIFQEKYDSYVTPPEKEKKIEEDNNLDNKTN